MKNWQTLLYVGLGAVAGYYATKHWFVTGGRVI